METFKDRMKRIRQRAGFKSQADAASAVGCERGTVSMWEAPSSPVTAVSEEYLFRVGLAYRVRPDWINSGIGDDGYFELDAPPPSWYFHYSGKAQAAPQPDPDALEDIQQFGFKSSDKALASPTGLDLLYVDKVIGASLSAGSGELLWEYEQVDNSHAFRADWMRKKGLRPERCKVWQVEGESMDPKYPHASWVLINMGQRDPVHGKNFALVGEDGLRLKQLRRSESGGWIMYSLNPDQIKYPPEPIVGENYAIIGRVRGHGGDDD